MELSWQSYIDEELKVLTPALSELGIDLDEEQPHVMGERFLMHNVTTSAGAKLILLGHKGDRKVVVKATRDIEGKKELQDARHSKEILNDIDFAAQTFRTPDELFFGEKAGFLISVSEFIEQDSAFIDRSIEEQFAFALSSFKAQEGAHAATYGHIKTIEKTFPIYNAEDYLKHFNQFKETITNDLAPLLEQAGAMLSKNIETIEQYCGFLVHTDFVPHNIRIQNGNVFLLDHSSIRFGNKYEGWARFLNFMALYNPELEKHLTEYVANNRTHEESLSLQLMRIYRLTELMCYYTTAANKSDGDLKELNTKRIFFWAEVLKAQLEGNYVSKSILEEYKKDRENLRSPAEKKRQVGLH